MPLTPINLGLRSNVARDTSVGNAQLINCYADDIGTDAKAGTPIYACDGFAAFSTLTGASGVRGMLNLDDSLLWVLNGDRLDSVTTAGVATNRATVNTSGYAYFARNRAATPNIAMVTSGGVTRFITGTTVTTPSFNGAIGAGLFNSVCHHDGYFIFTKSNGEFYISNLESTVVDIVDFATAQASGDGLVRAVVRGRDLCLYGTHSLEFWQNVAATDFPYQRAHVANVGAYAAPAVVALAALIDGNVTDTVIWPATGPDGGFIGILMLAGYDAKKISTWEVDNAIRTATKANVRGYAYSAQGQTFYAVTDGATWTYEYNCRTGLWHRRTGAGLGFSRIVAATTFNNQVILGDYASGALYQMAAGTPSGDSNVEVRVSKDNGATWSAARSKSVGTAGQRNRRTRFNRFGQSKEDGFQIEIKITRAFVEAGSDVDMTIVTPPVHAQPYPIQMHALHVDAIPGVSGTAGQRGAIALHADITRVGA